MSVLRTEVIGLSLFAILVIGCTSIARSAHDEDSDIKPSNAQQNSLENDSVSSNFSLLGRVHPSSILPEFANCIYLDYNATSPIFPEVSAVSSFQPNYSSIRC